MSVLSFRADSFAGGTPVPRGSYCTRCLKPAPAAELLANDHLCDDCAGKSDSEHAQEIIERERETTKRGDA